MTLCEIYRFYRELDSHDFWGRAMRRVFDFAIPQISYSQAGEDMVVDYLFQGTAVKPYYLELGTNHPRFGNNTYKFYRNGCRGVLVEADPSLISCIRRFRRRDTVLNVGVSAGEECKKKFYVMSCSSLNTFDEQEARERGAAENIAIKAVVDVSLLPLNTILQRYCEALPDFLSIDIEGLDLAVLKSLNFDEYPIPVICAETGAYSTTPIKRKDRSIEQFLRSKGYFVYADTYINTIFVNQSWFNQFDKVQDEESV